MTAKFFIINLWLFSLVFSQIIPDYQPAAIGRSNLLPAELIPYNNFYSNFKISETGLPLTMLFNSSQNEQDIYKKTFLFSAAGTGSVIMRASADRKYLAVSVLEQADKKAVLYLFAENGQELWRRIITAETGHKYLIFSENRLIALYTHSLFIYDYSGKLLFKNIRIADSRRLDLSPDGLFLGVEDARYRYYIKTSNVKLVEKESK